MATQAKRNPNLFQLDQTEQDRVVDQPDRAAQKRIAARDQRFLNKLAAWRERMNSVKTKSNPYLPLVATAIGVIVVITLCALVGGLPILLAFLKWGWGVIVLIVSVGGLVGLCCLTFILVGVAGWLAFKLGLVKTPSPTPKPKAASAPASTPDKK